MPSSRVYYDPLAPAFHGNVFNNASTRQAQERRTARMISSLQSALETGEINPVLRRQIFEGAEKDISELPPTKRLIAERNRLYMRQLKDAIESGLDVRTMPQLFNYLIKEVQSNLYRVKDDFFQPALEDAFRVAIDTEQSFYSGRRSAETVGPILGAGRRSINVQGQAIEALEFQMQGHKMLFAGNAAMKFKHALGGFDLDDKGIVMPRVFKDASGTERLSTFIFRQPTGPAEFIFAMPRFGSSDTIKMFLENNDALMQQLESVKNQDKLFDLMYRSLTARGADKATIDRALAELATADLIDRPDAAGAIEQKILDLMSGAERGGLYKRQFISYDDQIMDMLRREGRGLASPLELTRERVEELIAKGSDFVDEQFLVNQYNYGSLLRVFKEAGEFNFFDETQSELRAFFGDQTGRVYGQEEIGQALSGLSGRRARKLQAIIESDYQRRAVEAVSKQENIGQYINKMLIATASSDQEEQIIQALRARGLGTRVDEIISKTTAAIISPSDVVDIITNLSGKQFLYGESMHNQYAVLKELMDSNGPEATLAIERILMQRGYSEGKALSQDVANAAIEAKFERIGRLRAMALESGMSGDLLAGIDPEFIKARLKGPDDLIRALSSLRKGFTTQAGNLLETNDAMRSYLEEVDLAARAQSQSELNDQVIRVAGMAVDSKFAHASAMAKIGRNNRDAIDAFSDAVNARRTTQYLGEINTSRQATTVAENILNEYSKLISDNSEFTRSLLGKTGEEGEFFAYEALVKRQQIGEQIRSMIFAGAEGTEGTTVQDILDNMERLSDTSRFRNVRSYQSLLTATGDENDIKNLVYASQRARELKFLKRQEGIENLANQLDDMIAQTKLMTSEDRADILRQSRDVLESHVRMNTSRVSDDHRLAAAFINFFEPESGLDKMGLDEDTLLISRRILQFSNARRYLSETGMEDVLSYSGTGQVADFAPTALDDEVRARVLSGALGDDQEEALANLAQENRGKYKRVTDSWRSGKLGEAFDNPIVKKSAYAAVGLMAASFIYAAAKDRGEQEMSGPPLLPGGSAYENLPQRTPQIPEPSMFSGYKPGVGYSVHIEGSRDQIEAFGNSARSVAKGPINSTMSRGLPQLGRDPYSEVARSF